MKKLILSIALIAILATGTVFASPNGFSIGVHGGTGGVGSGGGLNLTLPGVPVFWYFDAAGLGDNTMYISGAGDFLFLFDTEFVPTLSFYIRGGIGAAFWSFSHEVLDNYVGLAASFRLPIGLSWRPIELLEIFLQAVPQIGLQILPIDNIRLWGNYWGGNLGIRLWL